jgi:signal transduction histidine kinase
MEESRTPATEIKTVSQDLLNETLKEIMGILGAECGSLFLFDRNKNELVLDSFYNSGRISVKDIRRRIGEGVAGKVIQSRSPVLVSNIELDDRFSHNGYNHYRTKSFISIPLFVCDELIGLINIADKSTGESFSEKDLAFTVALCKYACRMVENADSSSALKQEKEILEKYASVGKLAAGIVHEVNNPLDGIIRYVNILLSHIEENSISREYLTEVKKGLSRIANTTRSLLSFSHQVNSDTPRFKRYVRLQDLIEEALESQGLKFDGRFRIKHDYSPAVPKVLDLGLEHVLNNLIKNAMDAMPEGGELEIATEMLNSMVRVSIKDTGTGIAPELKERIFEPFFTTKPREKGTGLGLSICKEIVTRFGGDIAVESRAGLGTTFTILIPVKYLEANV